MVTNIEWTDRTWNPVTGCSKVSQGCKNCYAERMAKRLKAMNQPRYLNGFNVTVHEDLLDRPSKWKKPCKVFVNSMSDLFHEHVPIDFIAKVFDSMFKYDHHIYQVLTKRPERIPELFSYWETNNYNIDVIPKHIWIGTSIENMDVLDRITRLIEVKAEIRFLSCEPLLGPLYIECYLADSVINWVIVGGESGPKSRSLEKQWVIEIRDQCLKHDIPFFFKQWGGKNKKKTGRLIDGKEYLQLPQI